MHKNLAIGSVCSVSKNRFAVIVSSPKDFDGKTIYRARPISSNLAFATTRDVIINDTSITGFPFLIEAWNEQPILLDEIIDFLGTIDGDIEPDYSEEISLTDNQKAFMREEIKKWRA